MTVKEARLIVLSAIGGHQFAASDPAFITVLHSAVRRVAGICEPENLIATSKPQTSFLRVAREGVYIRDPKIAGEDDEIDLVFDLQFAAIYFVCALFATEGKNWFLGEAKNVIDLYVATSSTSVAALAPKHVNRERPRG